MKPLFTQQEYQNAKAKEKLLLECYVCGNPFQKYKRYISSYFKHGPIYHNSYNACRYCSKKCENRSRYTSQRVSCKQCNKTFLKHPNQIKKTKNNFCSKSCAAKYNNVHKTKGNRRSKLEIWIEQQLNILYPFLYILYNNKTTINSEIDIYIPSLNLAFELNGIYHYEPIHGYEKLCNVQNNDKRKFQACLIKNIELCIIDTSALKYFKPKNASKYLNIILDIIQRKSG